MTKPILNGGFIQFDQDVLKELQESDWNQILDRMKALGMRTLILQYLGQADTDADIPLTPDFLYEDFRTGDPVPWILEKAKAAEIDVYLGLINPPTNPGTNNPRNAQPGFWKESQLSDFTKANQAFAQKVWEKYKDYSAWKGWYISLENWVGWYPKALGNATEWPEAWATFYRNISETCKGLNALPEERNPLPNKRPVAISPALPSKNGNYVFDPTQDKEEERNNVKPTTEEKIETFIKTLDNAGVDIVMLQDSVGSKGWKPDQLAKYYSFIKRVCEDNQMDCWANIESFEKPDLETNIRIPCEFSRLKEQLSVTADFNLGQRVTFDFFHYMNGVVKLKRWNLDYFERMQRLYEDYKGYVGEHIT
ncbi:MAG: DUF4434 domain-containing protein [Leptolyngbyaceae cyanobacterium]